MLRRHGRGECASAPVPIAAVVPRARKLAASAKPPVLEKAESGDRAGLQKATEGTAQSRKAEKPKKKKKKKPPVETSPDEFAADEATGDGAPVAPLSVGAAAQGGGRFAAAAAR